jgi:nucleotide-binding universal stress UspA family protein
MRVEGAVPAILQTAREEQASLIAMATHGRTGLPHLLLGGICEGVLRESPVPVFAVRPFRARPPRPAFRNILVPLDGGAASLAILPVACAFAALFGSRLIFLHVLDRRKAALAALGRAERERAGDETPPLETAAHQCAAEGLRSRILVDTGDVRDRILARVRSEAIDLVAMTTHGRRGLSRLLLGSVSEVILRRAEVPLLLCRETARSNAELTEAPAD